jgi:hypothetical protein
MHLGSKLAFRSLKLKLQLDALQFLNPLDDILANIITSTHSILKLGRAIEHIAEPRVSISSIGR